MIARSLVTHNQNGGRDKMEENQNGHRRTKNKMARLFDIDMTVVRVVLLLFVAGFARGSEVPDRECCDPVYPPHTEVPTTAPDTQTVLKPGVPTRLSIAILNCLMARQLCFEDASCSAILEIIPRVCGSELVACSTVTVTKCQAALKTLQAFPFFKPTCLCKEPNVEPECNSFRDFLFDHPCMFVIKKEKDPYPVETLPTCTYALSVCNSEPHCLTIFEKFKTSCRVREGECRMENRDSCKEAWSGLRMSPLFGCICPNNHIKKRCDRIFSIVNHNPCIEPACPPSVMSLFKSDSTRQAQSGLTRYVAPDGSLLLLTEDGTRLLTRSAAAEVLRHALQAKPQLASKDDKRMPDSLRNSTRNLRPIIGNETNLEETVISSGVLRHVNEFWSPHLRRNNHHLDPGGSLPMNNILSRDYKTDKNQIGNTNNRFEDEIRGKLNLQSTCHNALTTCLQTTQCADALTPVLRKCDTNSCDREGCMRALRSFYRVPHVGWSTEIAFCLCKKSENNLDGCLSAQDRLHPTCAQKPGPNDAVPACHVLAHNCREDSECRERLENYEQWCAVDSVTHGCAGSPDSCRKAVIAALGTELRANCACRGTDLTQLYECLGWQRLLWLNPCVVEAQSDYHIKTYGITYETTPQITTNHITPPPEKQQKPTTHHHRESTKVEERKKLIIQQTTKQETPHVEEVMTTEIMPTTTSTTEATTTVTSTAATTTTTRRATTMKTTTTVDPAKYCVVQWEDHQDQFIKMGDTKRLYRSAATSECTEVCACDSGLRVSCHAACVPRAPCSSRLAHYAHSAPAYRAYRGRCYCYSGAFICMRPDPNEYKLPTGVYLLLGYSSVDEALLRPHTGLGVEDAVRVLQDYLETMRSVDNNCTLSMFNMSNENLVIAASLPSDQKQSFEDVDGSLLDKEKEECVDLLTEIKTRINSQHRDITSHLLLSIFKIAEVDVVYPAPPNSATKLPDNYLCLILAVILIVIQFKNRIAEYEFKSNERYFLDDLDIAIFDVYDENDIFIDSTIYKALVDAPNAYNLNVLDALSFCLLMKLIHIENAVNVTIYNRTLKYFSNDFQTLFERVIFENDNTTHDKDIASSSYGLA